MIRVLLAHGGPLMRAGIRSILAASPQIEVVAEVSRTEEALPAVEAGCPDVVLMDSDLDGALDPLEVVRHVRAPGRAPPVLVLSRADDAGMMCRMFGAGAAGWVSERASPRAILHAIMAAAQAQDLWTPRQLEELAGWQREVGRRLEALTPREREVLELIAEGLSNRQIAARLVLAVSTVEVHVRNVLDKLAVHSRVEAAVLFLVHGRGRAGRGET